MTGLVTEFGDQSAYSYHVAMLERSLLPDFSTGVHAELSVIQAP
jgi:hypothetical protein